MKCVNTIVFLCLVVSLTNVAGFRLLQNGIQLTEDVSDSRSSNRQLHKCLFDCDVTRHFNETFTIPEECTPIETESYCTIISIIDYTNQEISFYSYENSQGLTIENITYDSSIIHAAYFEFSYNSIYHIFDYTCLTGDQCEWIYMQEIVPNLIKLNYQRLYDLLSPFVDNSDVQPDMTKCYNNNNNNMSLINCSTGSCWFVQSIDENYNPEIIRDCAFFDEASIEIGRIRFFPGAAKHDYDTITFTCNLDECNSEVNEATIKRVVSENGNEYIRSLGSRFDLTRFSLFLLSFSLMIFFK